MPRFRVPLLLLSSMLLVGLLGPVLAGRPFCDDFEFVLDDPARHVFGSFGELHPYRYYRPIELSLVALSQALFGPTTLPTHLISILVHVTLIALVLHVLRRLDAPQPAPAVAALFLATTQLAAPALGGNDTLSLVLATFWGSVALWCFWPARHRDGRRWTGAGFFALTLALLSKESSIGLLPVAVLFLGHGVDGRDRRALAGAAVRIGAVALLGAVSMAWRARLGAEGPDFGPGGNWSVGTHVATNLAQLWAAALLPVSTLDVFTGVATGRLLWPGLGLLLTALLAAATLVGLGRRRTPRALLLAGAACLLVAPVLFRKHVSELYAYTLVPVAALILAVGLAPLLVDRRRGVRAGTAFLLGLCFALSGAAVHQKAVAMARNGSRAAARMGALVDTARGLAPSGCLVLLEPRFPLPEYSVYRMNGFRLTPPAAVVRFAGRPDIRVVHVEAGIDGRRVAIPPDASWVTLTGERLDLHAGPPGPGVIEAVRLRTASD